MTTKTVEQFAAAHDALPDEAHVCPEYSLTPEGCYRATACVECGTRRDEHADQPEQSSFPWLDITDHVFVEPQALCACVGPEKLRHWRDTCPYRETTS